MHTGSHDILLSAEAERLTGFLDREPIEIAWGPDTELDYASPAYNAVTANRLGRTAEFDVVFLDPFTCEPTLERQRYEHLGDDEVATPVGRFSAHRWSSPALHGLDPRLLGRGRRGRPLRGTLRARVVRAGRRRPADLA